MDVSDFRIVIENLSEKYFERGIIHNQNELKKVMGL